VIKQALRSRTDLDAGWLSRAGKPTGFHYLSHTSLDAQNGIITDVYVTAANLNDFQPYIARIQEQKERFSLAIKEVEADRGYDYPEVHYGLSQLGITGYIPPADKPSCSTVMKVRELQYDQEADVYQCPAGNILKYTHMRNAGNRVHKVYASRARDCGRCLRRQECFGRTARNRIISRPLYQDLVEQNEKRAATKEYARVQKLRRTWCEGTFGLMKREHNLGKTYKRGRENVLEHCLFSALAINLKRMVKLLA
jgi:hypothetical protein